jgi:HSP20 family protein
LTNRATNDEDGIIRDIRHLQENLERLLSDFSRLSTPALLGARSLWRPLTDVYETDRELVVRVEIAGMDAADMEVILKDRVLTIRGVRRDPTPTGNKHFHKMEISVGPFERTVVIPPNLNITGAEAHYENGYLVVRVDKGLKRSRVKRRNIPVE